MYAATMKERLTAARRPCARRRRSAAAPPAPRRPPRAAGRRAGEPAPGSRPAGRLGVNRCRDDAQLWRAVDTFRVLALAYAVARVRARRRRAHARLARLGACSVVMAVLDGRIGGRHAGRRPAAAPPCSPPTWPSRARRSCRPPLVDDPSGSRPAPPRSRPLGGDTGARLGARAGGRRRAWAPPCCVAAADLVEVGGCRRPRCDDIVLLLLAGAVVGYAVDLLRAGRADLARAGGARGRRAGARAARGGHPRLGAAGARATCSAAGGSSAARPRRSAELAGEQEVRLRALIAPGPGRPRTRARPGEERPRGRAGRAWPHRRRASRGPASPCLLPAAAAHALRGAVRAALDNVRRHAGARAPGLDAARGRAGPR